MERAWAVACEDGTRVRMACANKGWRERVTWDEDVRARGSRGWKGV